MKLSIVIVNYNVKHYLEQCLYSTQKAIKNIHAEVIVVDNNSVDHSIEMIKQKFPWVVTISNSLNTGFSVANNQAISISKGKYILLLNPDTLVEEDTFEKCIHFMENNINAGGLGVKMVDGKGKFLPESKRSLPRPMIAFYKIFGLSSLFPKSKVFGSYHLGHLSKDQTHSVEVLSGAFMMIRKKTLDQIGLLDESFFMYGEDIDLSYRIILGGFKNYYFSGTRIIHYKGESTKKGSLNYVFIFYKAMIIFAKKHFSNKNATLFTLLIYFAIYFRASLSIIKRFISWIFLPILDFSLIFLFMFYLKDYWENNYRFVYGGSYPNIFIQIIIPIYIVLWLGVHKLVGVYDKPFKLSKLVLGTLFGTLILLALYSMFPEAYRFSRALILIGSVGTGIIIGVIRVILGNLKFSTFNFQKEQRKRFLIVGSSNECHRVFRMLKDTKINSSFIGFIITDNPKDNNILYLGSLDKLQEAIQIYLIDELIFCSKDISAREIISYMSFINQHDLDFKIAPEESMYVIGSNSINAQGELYAFEVNSINKPENIRIKRLFDIFISILLFLISPILIVLNKSVFKLYKNILLVLFGLKSWVSYYDSVYIGDLPKIKPGILSPSSHLKLENYHKTYSKLNLLYAKEYRLINDFEILLKNLNRLT